MPRFIVQHLKIERMPGFPTGIPKTFEFSPHINIIHGANATGKSSIARAISNLFWHDQHDKYMLNSRYSIDEKVAGDVSIAFGKMQFSGLGPLKEPEELKQSRANMNLYALSLESMINEKETNIAQNILRESNGGFDLKKIMSDKDRTQLRITNGNPILKHYNSVKEDLNREIDRQSSLSDKSSELAELNQQIKICDDAVAQVQRLKDIISWVDASDELKAQQSAFGHFHPDLEKMTGTEATLLGHAVKRKMSAEDEYKREEIKHQSAIKLINALRLPQEGLDLVALNVIEKKIIIWNDVLKKIDDHRMQLSGLEKSREGLLHIIGDDVDPSTMEPIGEDLISELEDLIRTQLEHHHKKDARQEQIDLFQKQLIELGKPTYPESAIAPAKVSVQRWLESPAEEKKSTSGIMLAVISIALIMTVILVLLLNKWFVIIALLILISLYFTGKKQNETTPNQQRDVEIKRLNELGINTPSTLTSQTMTTLLTTLLDAERVYEARRTLGSKKELIEEELTKIDQLISGTDSALSDLKLRIKNFPENPSTPSPTYILRFLDAWLSWHKHTHKMLELEGQIEDLERSALQLEQECREALHRIGQPFTPDTILLQQQLEDLKDRETERRGLVKDRDQAALNLMNLKERIQKETAEIEEILEMFSPENKSLSSIETLQHEHDSFKEAKVRLRSMEQQVASMREKLPVDALPDLFEAGQLVVPRIFLEDALKASNEQSALRDECMEKRTELETLIKQARDGQRLEVLMSDRDIALSKLDKLLDDHLDALGLKAVTEVLTEAIDTESRPEILNAAGAYFASFTHGRYQLFVTPDDEGKFIVSDDLTGRRQELSELSAATKLQLVLAVRLAYISHIEKGLKLPIMVDEVMMNSDERRAAEIMGTLINISKERQVFYFTASHAERLHWHRILENANPPVCHMFISLDGTLEVPPAMMEALENPFESDGAEVPSAEGMSHADYGRSINPPGFHPIISSSDQLHIWYLIEDPIVVEKLLRLKIYNWRILLNIWNQNLDLVGMDPLSMERYGSMIQVLSDYQELYRTGRNRPINEDVLRDSGAITDTFFERVCELMKRHKGDPQALIDSIDRKELKGFSARFRQQLYEYLVKNDYLTESTPFSNQEIKSRMLISVDRYGLDQSMMERFFDRIFERELKM